MSVEDLMTRSRLVAPNASLRTVAETLAKHPISGLRVCEPTASFSPSFPRRTSSCVRTAAVVAADQKRGGDLEEVLGHVTQADTSPQDELDLEVELGFHAR
jgi:hypothetical protein